ncbi:MAG TPA: hypothetical protein VG435_14520 [Acidimicrobiales bacterium]|nr:hypothetical protein [Acidimicrobiales bacterium]
MATRSRRARRRRARRRLFVLVVILAGAITGGVLIVRAIGRKSVSAPVGCQVAGLSAPGQFALTADQAQNASIIAAVAFKLRLPDHAVTIGLATALQESRLVNLTYGDRDSLGLFQQRPSEGWGTSAQVQDPVYAATAFYQHLERIPGWQTMAVTEAAQTVQHSAAPLAYATYEDEARALAAALTGETPAGFTCLLAGFEGARPAPSALAAAAAQEMGSDLLAGPVTNQKTGWEVASWAVGHAWAYHLETVTFGSWRWTSGSGRWVDAGGPAVVSPEVAVTYGT